MRLMISVQIQKNHLRHIFFPHFSFLSYVLGSPSVSNGDADPIYRDAFKAGQWTYIKFVSCSFLSEDSRLVKIVLNAIKQIRWTFYGYTWNLGHFWIFWTHRRSHINFESKFLWLYPWIFRDVDNKFLTHLRLNLCFFLVCSLRS